MWCNLFYDKYAGDENGNGDHHFGNPITSKVTINDLDDGSYNSFVGKDALEMYNKKFGGSYFILPESVYKSALLKLILYQKIVNSIETIFIIISVNVSLLENLIRTNKPIENIEFLKQLCRYHMAYTETNKFMTNSYFYNNETKMNKINKNINYITENAMKAVDYTFDNKIDQPEELSNVELFEYQKCSIYWATQQEDNKKKILYNLNDEIILGNVYYDITTKTFDLIENKKNIQFNGGAIIDEVGLGKTLQVIGLGLCKPADHVSYTKDGINKFISKATLILCPNQLCGQWLREFRDRISNKSDVNVVQILTKRDFDKLTYNDLLDADFVVVSYTFLDNKAFTLPWTSQISAYKNFSNQKWRDNEIILIKKLFDEMGTNLIKNPIDSLCETNPLIQLIHWHRVVVDEFHEIYNDNRTYTYISNLLPFISADNKWCVSATPFNQQQCLLKIVDFITDYKNKDDDKIFLVESVIDYLSSNCFRRNTKDSVKKEHTLPPIREEIRWLKFTPTERMIYNAYLANHNNNKLSVYLRQLCCHPQLADETKYALSNCKTLDDIEKMMVQHYKLQVDEAQEKVDIIQKRIKKLNKKKRKIEKNQKKKQLKKLKGKLEANVKVCSDSEENSESEDDVNADADDYSDVEMDDNLILLLGENGGGLDFESSVTLDKIKDCIHQQELKLKELTNILDGKKSTYEFFNNVVNKIRKTVNKETDKNKNFDPSLDDDTNIINMFSQKDNDDKENDDEVCGICLDEIPEDDIGVTKCGHIFCHECLKLWMLRSTLCPYCKKKLLANEIYVLSYEKKNKADKLKPEEKDKQELINEVGTKLANLITYLRESDEHTIIFSQWDDLLRRIGRILKENNIQNVFCKGNCYQRDKAIREFNEDNRIKVIMLSSDSTAAGTNLTKATQVIFTDPIYGNYKFRKDQEKQAIGRAHRLGQNASIKIVRFIIKDSVEDEIYKMNVNEDKNYKSDIDESNNIMTELNE